MSRTICSHRHIGSRPRQCLVTSSHPCMCTWLLECCLLPLSLPRSQVLLPPLPDSCHGAWREFHGRSPVQLRHRKHGQPGLCHTPTQVMSPRTWSSQTPMSSTSRPSSDIYFQELPRRHSLFLQPRHRRRRARQASCSRGR